MRGLTPERRSSALAPALALVLALVAAAAAAPLAAATHNGLQLFHEIYAYSGSAADRDYFLVPPTTEEHKVVCYQRLAPLGTKGVWTASVADRFGIPVVQDVVAGDPEDGEYGESLAFHVSPVGFTGGPWSISMRAQGASPGINVTITYVQTLDDCTWDH